ncbi:MAG: RNase H-like domain-containing protein [Candidatus Thiodiazotropha endolucinida]|nr:DDE-type integrase/transposase/recombinase [Candidatus Thiodiazotropha taylori]MCW4345368.1 RNase H-like domain-containing protein [Candidatus Thiodiazotropha endolucinida]
MDWDKHDLEQSWKSFKQHVQFMFDGPLKAKDEEEKCAFLMLWVGEKGRSIFQTWNLSDENKKKLKSYFDGFESYVKPTSNTIYNRYKFQSRMQNQDETFEQFVTELQLLVKDCEYDKQDEMVRDRIVTGVKNSKIRAKLLNEGSKLTLAKTLDLARTHELSHSQCSAMEDKTVNALKKKQYKSEHDSKYNKHKTEAKQEKKTCGKCGYEHGKLQCPAYGKRCTKCKRFNHFHKMCKTKLSFSSKLKKKHVHAVEDSSDSSDNELYAGMINDLPLHSVNPLNDEWSVNSKINDKSINFQIDTGARCNVMSQDTFHSIGIKTPLKQTSTKLTSFSGHKLRPAGVVQLPCEIQGNDCNIDFYIVDSSVPSVLGGSTCREIGLIQRLYNIHANELPKQKDLPQDIENSYKDLFEGLGCMPDTYSIKVDPSVKPVIHPPRKIPISMKEKVKSELKRMEAEGVIKKQTQPTDWVNSMVVVPKSNGKVRICIDPRDLNKAVLREHYPMKTIDDILMEIPEAKVFSKLDAVSGYWQICLSHDSEKLCTFNTPLGRYSFTRLPYGLKSAGEVYQRSVSNMVQDIEGCEAIVDDILIWGKDIEEHDRRLQKVLNRIREYNMKLNRDKCEFRKSSISYVGHILTGQGIKPDPEKVRAVKEMMPPTDVKGLQTYMGFVNYLAKFIPNMSEITAPLRQLLENTTQWHWDSPQQNAFDLLKEKVTNAPVLRFYDPKLELTMSVDASSKGLGCVLLQEGQPIAYASRALTKCQQNYAQIEKETLAITFGCRKMHQYVYGRTVTVESDQKPLQAIFSKPLHQTPLRLQKLLLDLQKYDLKVIYKPGNELFLADHLSRAYLQESKEDLISDSDLSVNYLSFLPVSKDNQMKIQNATKQDSEMQTLRATVLEGWPQKKDECPSEIRPYWNFRDEITFVEEMLFKGHKLIVPKSLRKEMLAVIHSSHLGINKCTSRARESLFWIGMVSDIEQTVRNCTVCAQNQSANTKEPMIPGEVPDRPWSHVSADIMEFKNHHYLVIVDRYSKWVELNLLENMTSKCVIKHLKSQFSRYGIIDQFYSDNQSTFVSSEFRDFAKEYGFDCVTSSPTYAQSNGLAERAVRTVKNLLKKAEDPYLAMLAYRNSVIDTDIMLSPAEIMFGRKLKTTLPTSAPLLEPTGRPKNLKRRFRKRQKKQKGYYDRGSKPLKPLKPGENVLMQGKNTWTPATVTEEHSTPRSYIVENQYGQQYRRNRRHLRSTSANFPTDLQPENRSNVETTSPSTSTRESNNITDPSARASTNSDTMTSTQSATSTSSEPYRTKSGRTVVKPAKYKDYVM